jgi:hypothetical protein
MVFVRKSHTTSTYPEELKSKSVPTQPPRFIDIATSKTRSFRIYMLETLKSEIWWISFPQCAFNIAIYTELGRTTKKTSVNAYTLIQMRKL